MAEQPPQPSLYAGGGTRPIPDPTELTNQMILREIAALKEVITTRLDAMDKAIVVLADGQAKLPTEVDRRIAALNDTLKERFNSIDMRAAERIHTTEVLFDGIRTQFKERDERAAAAKSASDTAVAAALQAAKEAVGAANESFQQGINKSEASTSKSIDQLTRALETLGTTQTDKLAASEKTLSAQISEIGSRVTRLESQGIGRTAAVAEVRNETTTQRAQSTQNQGLILGLAALSLTVVGLLVAVITLLGRA